MRIPNQMLRGSGKSTMSWVVFFPHLLHSAASESDSTQAPLPSCSPCCGLSSGYAQYGPDLHQPTQLSVCAPNDSHLIVIGCKLPSLEQQSMHTRPMGSAVGLHTTGRSRRPQYHSNFRRLTAQTRVNHIARIVQRSSHSRYKNSLCSHDGDPAASRDIRDCLMLHKIVSKNRIHPIT